MWLSTHNTNMSALANNIRVYAAAFICHEFTNIEPTDIALHIIEECFWNAHTICVFYYKKYFAMKKITFSR